MATAQVIVFYIPRKYQSKVKWVFPATAGKGDSVSERRKKVGVMQPPSSQFRLGFLLLRVFDPV
jgi:hypothetical protein